MDLPSREDGAMHSEVFETSAEGLWKMFDSPAIRDYQYPPLLSPFPIIPNIVVCLYGDAPRHAYGVCDFSLLRRSERLKHKRDSEVVNRYVDPHRDHKQILLQKPSRK